MPNANPVPPIPTFEDFLWDVSYRYENGNERYGQALFNACITVRPGLASQLRGTLKDPFYGETKHDERVVAALDFLRALWDEGDGAQ